MGEALKIIAAITFAFSGLCAATAWWSLRMEWMEKAKNSRLLLSWSDMRDIMTGDVVLRNVVRLGLVFGTVSFVALVFLS